MLIYVFDSDTKESKKQQACKNYSLCMLHPTSLPRFFPSTPYLHNPFNLSPHHPFRSNLTHSTLTPAPISCTSGVGGPRTHPKAQPNFHTRAAKRTLVAPPFPHSPALPFPASCTGDSPLSFHTCILSFPPLLSASLRIACVWRGEKNEEVGPVDEITA
jgi:hypothetical protein